MIGIPQGQWGGIVQCGGVHLEWTYIFGSYFVVPLLGGLLAK